MRSKDNVEEAIKRDLSFTASTELHDRMLNDVLSEQEKSKKTKSAVDQPNLRRQIMRSPITKLTTAAAIFIVSFTGFFLLKSTGSGIALADVLAQIEQIKTYSCQMSANFKSKDINEMPVSESTMLVSQTLGSKINIEITHPMTGENTVLEIYILPHKGTITTLMPNEKKYSQVYYDKKTAEASRQGADPREMLEQILDCEHTSLGRSTIDGIECEGFQTTDPSYVGGSIGQATTRIWVDVHTKLPVRMQVDKGVEKTGYMRVVLSNFEWDVSVDAAEFEPVIPDDYTPGKPMMQMLPAQKTNSE
jgi:hypothetical protein